MMSMLDHPFVRDYLNRLHQEATRLPAHEGREHDLVGPHNPDGGEAADAARRDHAAAPLQAVARA